MGYFDDIPNISRSSPTATLPAKTGSFNVPIPKGFKAPVTPKQPVQPANIGNAKRIGDNLYQTPSGTTWKIQPDGTRIVTLAKQFGGGAYTVDPNNTNKVVNTGHTTYGGESAVKGKQRDDIIPVGLGGVNSSPDNIRLENLLNGKGTATDPLEKKVINDYKAGRISLGNARLQIMTAKPPSNQITPKQIANKDLPLETVKQIPQAAGNTILNFAKGLVQPFAEASVSVANQINNVKEIVKGVATGRSTGVNHGSDTYNLPILGETKPLITGQESPKRLLQKSTGAALQFAPYILAQPEVKGVVSTLDTLGSKAISDLSMSEVKQFTAAYAKKILVSSATLGTMYGGGQSLQEGSNIKQTVKNILTSSATIAGMEATLSPIIGAIMKRGGAKTVNDVMKQADEHIISQKPAPQAPDITTKPIVAQAKEYPPVTAKAPNLEPKTARMPSYMQETNPPEASVTPKTAPQEAIKPKAVEPLHQEALKYKSADEFVKAQGEAAYHGTPVRDTFETGVRSTKSAKDVIETSGLKPSEKGTYGKAVYLARLESDARGFVQGNKGTAVDIIPIHIDPKAKIYDFNPEAIYKNSDALHQSIVDNRKNAAEILTKAGYDGIETSGHEIAIFNPDVLKTKSQLTDIYNKAHEGKMYGGLPDTADVKDITKAVIGNRATEAVKEVKNALSPQTASPEAQASADYVRKAKAEIANQNALEQYKFKDVTKSFAKQSNADNIANISSYEKTGKFTNAPEGYSEFYKSSIDHSREVLQKAYGTDRVGYIENYVRRQFEFGSKADEAKATTYLNNKVGSLSANKSPLKGRVLDMPLEEALADMKARGIKVKPATVNPEVLRQWSVANAKQAITYADTWTQLKDTGVIKFVKQGGIIPEGQVKLNNRAAQVFYPTDAGMVKGGDFYADKNVARVLNNAVSKGLGGSPSFQTIRAINNTINQFQLSLSAFHLTGTAINAGVSDLALGIRQLAQGEFAKGTKSIGTSLLPGVSFGKDLYNGNKLIKQLTESNPIAEKFLKEKLNPAGGRLKVEQEFTNQAYNKMIESFKTKTVGGAIKGVLRIPQTIVETVAKPLGEYAIPRVKIGAFMDLANNITERMPNATEGQLNRAYAQAWDSIDNRFGQLVYDNLFWNKTGTDLAMVSTRSVGWNLGTVREIGGGITDLAKTATGKGVSDRTLYAAALPIYAGMIGAVYMYLHTGKAPQTAQDYFYPQNGLKDSKGNADRVSLPTYMKDVFAYAKDPLGTVEHKASPLLSMTFDLATNANYYGDMIRNPKDTKSQQLQQVGSYMLQNVLPFSIQQAGKTGQEGASVGQKLESFSGFTKAPASQIKSKEQQQASDAYSQEKGSMGAQTPEQQQAFQAKQALKSQASDKLKELKNDPNAADTFDQIAKDNPDLAKEIASQFKDEKAEIQAVDKTIKALGVKDGARAKFIVSQINQLKDKQAKADYYQHLLDVKVITPAVADQINSLLK